MPARRRCAATASAWTVASSPSTCPSSTTTCTTAASTCRRSRSSPALVPGDLPEATGQGRATPRARRHPGVDRGAALLPRRAAPEPGAKPRPVAIAVETAEVETIAVETETIETVAVETARRDRRAAGRLSRATRVSAPTSVVTDRSRAEWPMSPMRQPLPARSPSPPPTSMSKRVRSSPRTLASSTPSGNHTDVSCGKRRSCANGVEAELGERVLQQAADAPVPLPRLLEPFLEQHAEPGVQRVEHRDRRGVVIAARGADVVGEQSRGRGTTTARAPTGCAHVRPRGREADRRETGRDAEALLRSRVDGVDAPRVDLDRDATERRDRVDAQQACRCPAARAAARSRSRRRSTSPRAPPRACRAPGCAACASSRRCGSIARPHGSSTRTTSAPQRRATSHMRSPNTPLTPMITVSPGSSRLTKQASIPAEPVPLIGNVSALAVWNAARSRSAISSSTTRKSGSRWPRTGRWNASITSGYGFDGPGPRSRRSGCISRPDCERVRRGCRPPTRAARRSGSAASPTRRRSRRRR